jgi:hypothetical protein
MIKHIKTDKAIDINAEDIPVGTYFYGHPEGYKELSEHLFMKSYDSVIDVDAPVKTWSNPLSNIINYRPVDITITVNKFIKS